MLGTSSSESALPLLIEKLEAAGAAKPVVGLVVPTGYSFNLVWVRTMVIETKGVPLEQVQRRLGTA